MAFRDDVHALRTRIQTLEVELRHSNHRAQELQAELEELRHTIVRLRSGIRDEESLRKDPHLAASEALLPLAGILGVLITLAVATVFAPYQFHGHLQLDGQGVVNFFRQLREGGIGTVMLTLSVLPLAILPSIASVGMHMRKRFGWYAAMIAWTLWTVVCPPLGVYGLYALARKHIRDLFLVEPMRAPQPKVRVAVDPTSPWPAQAQAQTQGHGHEQHAEVLQPVDHRRRSA